MGSGSPREATPSPARFRGIEMRTAIVLLVMALASALVHGRQPPTPEPSTDAATYEVYAALFAPSNQNADAADLLFLLQETAEPIACEAQRRTAPAEWRAVFENHAQENARRQLLMPDGPLGRYNLISREALYRRFPGLRQGDWREFMEMVGKRPAGMSHGIRQVTAVGFDPSKTKAYVELTTTWCAECG